VWATLARRAAARPWAENRRLITATLLVVLARGSLRLRFTRLVALLRLAPGATPEQVDERSRVQAEAIGRSVRAVAHRLPGTTTCLAQAIAGSALLSLRGIESTVTLGVARDGTAPQGLAAHAWLRCGDELLTGGEGHERFVPVASYASAPRARRA